MDLLQIVHKGNLDRLKEILDESGMPADEQYSDYVLLRYTLWRGHRHIAKYLIEKGCRLNKHNKTSSNSPLHIAIKHEDIEMVHILLEKGACVESINHNGETPLHFAVKTKNDLIILKVLDSIDNLGNRGGLSPLHIACMRNNSVIVEELLTSDISINEPVDLRSPFWPSYTPLHYAVEYGRSEIVELLLKHGADICKKTTKSITPLHLAVQIGDTSIIDLILAAHNECTENPKDNQEFSHFHVACMRNNTTVVEGFLKRGVEVNACVSKTSPEYPGYTPLHLAVQHECAATVKLLLKYNPDVSIKNSMGITPLHLAITKENREIIDHILSAYNTCYTDLNPIDDRGLSHFHAACMRNNPDIVEFFLRNGVDINKVVSPLSTNWAEYTPLHLAVENNCDRTTEVLLKYGASIEAKEGKGMTPLHLSVVNLAVSSAKLLLENGADANTKTRDDWTSLHLAVEKGSHEIVQLLVDNGADVNSGEALQYSTPLHLATGNKHLKIIDVLLSNGANVYAKELGGLTALHTMGLGDPKTELDMDSVECYSKIIESLLSSGCDIDLRDGYGRTPLHVACLHRNLAGSYALLQHGADINKEDYNKKTPMIYCVHMSYNICNIFHDHVQKLKLINFRVSRKNERCYLRLKGIYKRQKRTWNEMEHNIEFSDRCREEIERMKRTKVDNFSSLYSIIFKDANSMASHVQNTTFRKIVEFSDFDKTFPIYGYLIKLQIKKGLARYVLMAPGIELLHECIGVELPLLCYETILRYLTNAQIESLIKAKG